MIRLRITTHSREELRDMTSEIRTAVRGSGVRHGVAHLWSLHTTCALTVNEGADPAVATDIARFLSRLVPQNGDFDHDEGNSDSHVKTSLFGPGLTLLIDDGDIVLGTWQRVFLAEWDGPRERQVAVLVQAVEQNA